MRPALAGRQGVPKIAPVADIAAAAGDAQARAPD